MGRENSVRFYLNELVQLERCQDYFSLFPQLWKRKVIAVHQKTYSRDFSGGPVGKTVLSMQGAQVQTLVEELDPACMPQLKKKRSHMPQLKISHAATKILRATTKTQHSQNK